MKIKVLILTAILSVVAALSLSQSNLVSAQNSTASPVTSPVTYYTYHLTGRIVYRLLNHVVPAPQARVVAKNMNSNEIFVAKPDVAGFYNLEVKQSSPSTVYQIKAVDQLGTTWHPALYNKIISSDVNRLNFVGTR